MSNINFNLVTTLGTAKGGVGGEYFKAGFNYKVVIEKCEWKKARDQREYVIISTQILASDCPEQSVGRKPAQMINMNLDTGQGTLADFLRLALTKLAIMSGDEAINPDDDAYWNEQLSDRALLSAVLEEQNVLMGVELYLYTKPVTTRAGKPFTLHEWSLTPTAASILA